MFRKISSRAIAALAVVALGCAGLQQPVEIQARPTGEKVVEITASSFAFEPNNILAQTGDVLELQVENASGADHNVTVVSPKGEVIASVDLPAKETARLEVRLGEPGTYEFYCDKPLHPTLGMKGVIEAK